MELLTPSPPLQLAGHHFSYGCCSPTTSFSSIGSRRHDHHHGVAAENSGLPEFTGEVGDRVTVAVGKSVEKCLSLLYFCFQRFGCREIVLIHVHQPSPTIPTLLGKLPASQANEEMVTAFRKEEIEQTRKLLFNYLTVCRKAQSKLQEKFRKMDLEGGLSSQLRIMGLHVLLTAPHRLKVLSKAENWELFRRKVFIALWQLFSASGKDTTKSAIPFPLKLDALGKEMVAIQVAVHIAGLNFQEVAILEKFRLYNAEVKAVVITIEAAQVKKGIIDLVNIHSIRKLVMGVVPDNCMKVKKTSSKAKFAAKNAPPFCEIWFVYKRKHVWTREASEGLTIFPSVLSPPDTVLSESLISSSSHNLVGELISNNTCLQTDSSNTGILYFGVRNQVHLEPDKMEVDSSSSGSCFTNQFDSLSSERLFPSDSDSKVEEEMLYNQLEEVMRLAETLKSEAFAELVKCKNLEAEAFEAINKVKVFDAACARESKLREEVEDILRITRQQQQKLLEQREEVTRDLQKMITNVSVLDIHLRRSTHRREEAAGELKFIQESLATLQDERDKLQQQKEEAMCQLEQCRSRGHTGVPNCDRFIQFFNESHEFTEFTLSDLQTATCDFSESFKIGEGGYGCVYKGEIFNQSVAVKKLHSYNIQCQSEFQQEVLVLSKLRHPNLVDLIGACSEAWSLVYEYLPNGSLQDHLFRKRNTPPLTWKTRTRIAAKISSALLFLHSSKPEKIIHGDLKPENILLDSCFNCKIGDFGICRLVSEESVDFPSFHSNTEPKSAFPYTDPELQRNGNLTPKSDIYSFGIIILQLLTARPPVGLTNEVRRAVLSGKLTSILDTSAGEWPTCLAERLVDVGLQCCELNSRDRPELTAAMVRELDQLHVPEELPVPSYFLCPILREIMNDPYVAADGFTYEGEAIRGWLEDGHDTSPMTNLKLNHLHLTPNHVLRCAIQDWLWQS